MAGVLAGLSLATALVVATPAQAAEVSVSTSVQQVGEIGVAATCSTWLYSTYSDSHCWNANRFRARVECDMGTNTYYSNGPWKTSGTSRAYCAAGDWAIRALTEVE